MEEVPGQRDETRHFSMANEMRCDYNFISVCRGDGQLTKLFPLGSATRHTSSIPSVHAPFQVHVCVLWSTGTQVVSGNPCHWQAGKGEQVNRSASLRLKGVIATELSSFMCLGYVFDFRVIPHICRFFGAK